MLQAKEITFQDLRTGWRSSLLAEFGPVCLVFGCKCPIFNLTGSKFERFYLFQEVIPTNYDPLATSDLSELIGRLDLGRLA